MSIDLQAIEASYSETRQFEPDAEFVAKARLRSRSDYEALYRESLDSPETFWKRETSELVFRTPWHTLHEWELPHSKWFIGATLNVTESCLDRHLGTDGRQEAAPLSGRASPVSRTNLTYEELHHKVVQFVGAAAEARGRKGDRVAIYMGMVPEVVVGMLACARIGATAHGRLRRASPPTRCATASTIAKAKLVLTQDGAYRRGSVVDAQGHRRQGRRADARRSRR